MQAVRRTRVGRADLLWCLYRGGQGALDEAAGLIGYVSHAVAVRTEEPNKLRAPTAAPRPQVEETPPEIEKIRFPFVMEHQTLEDVAMVDGMPQWLAEMDELAGDDLDPPRMAAAPRPVPLLPWSRLWPFLRAALGSDAHLGHIDFSAVVDRLARGRAVRRLPRVRLSGWARRCRLLLDFDDRLIPFRQDIRDTWRGLKRLRGEEGMEAIVLQAGPDGAWRKAGKRSPRIRGNLLPETGSAVLVLGDLGTCDAAPQTMEPWVRLGRRLRRHGVLPVALTPSPPRTWPGELLDHWRIFSWDRGTRLPRLRSSLQRSLHGRPECRMPVNPEDMTDQAATLLSAAILVEPALLRAIRLLLPGADVGVESAVWQLDYAISSPLGLVFEKDTLIRLQGRFSDHPLRELAVDRIGRYTDSLPPSVQCEQWLTYADFCPADQDRPEVRWARAYAGRLARTCYEDRHAMDPGRRQWFTRVLLRSNPQFWKNRSMAVGLVASNLDARKAGKFELPREIVPEDVKWMLGDKEETLIWTIRLRDGELMLDPKRGGQQNARGGWPPVDVRVGEFKASRRWAHIVTAEIGVGALVAELYPDKSNAVPMPPKGGMIISTDQEEVLVGMLERPEWASEMGCDQYGLYLAFMVAGVMQRMRWIPPGTFAMGSPEDERDRFENERQHQVTLTPGFWLADTACTQALWQAVTGEVPSHFKGHERPVENVSWEGCWEFIDKINDESAGLELRLPSEAEWEYACRAGKATPFSFGQNITPDEVNYDGNRPYADGKKGQDRSETIEVESLPCNPWGLYEMHGNVWEWCSDWYVDYPDGDATDPVGPEAGENRVLRGGSWASHGRNVRSAYRYYVHPGYRNDTFGFRLARGPLRSSGPGGAVRAPDEPTGRRPEGGGAVTLRLRKRKPVLPEWAIGGGEDDFGRYAEFEVISAIRINSAVQRMRWIAPGSFLMGSPDDEKDRDDDEKLHRVTLTQGFWLADTACSQELWEAVIGENPSQFKGLDRPVEQVSWDDCQKFIDSVNRRSDGLNLRLPTEAEWEYACRAGTATPFSFGDNITPAVVNYNGNYSYASGAKEEYREETVDVKLLPHNPWGLYQMHGNVHEWCADWFGDYPEGEVIDPVGPDTGGSRVLRGGSWALLGRYVRSASRSFAPPGYRYDSFGFRLARGQ